MHSCTTICLLTVFQIKYFDNFNLVVANYEGKNIAKAIKLQKIIIVISIKNDPGK